MTPSSRKKWRSGKLSELQNAIGFTFRLYSNEMVRNDKIKLISVDGIEPSILNFRSGKFPLASEVYAVTAGTENPNVQPSIEWIFSEEEQKLVDDTGFVPVQKKPSLFSMRPVHHLVLI
ncbi:hypothetical protein [Planococcus sp. ISL-109]|uniref:hypothetical protein n=1 Tax=Planococcus sp. ISL-109 TaxID=2819166 RepID=UPI001BEB05AD|nr:hypothetical protein [Planococcus sp. ISL-109]MBT2581644.1 hypothetical protein [Planococcus sp. ISL-109]